MPAKPKRLCENCGEKPSRERGLCSTCLTDVQHAEDAMDEVELQLSENLPLLSVKDIDMMVVDAARNESAMYDPGTPEQGESAGVSKLRGYLLSRGTYFRRAIIRKLMMMGLGEEDVMVEFLRNPALRRRWVDDSRDPRRLIGKDIVAIRNEKHQSKELGNRKVQRVERLEMQYREMMALANDAKTPAAIRFKAIEAAAKFEREISIMEKTIAPKPGHGDMPVTEPTQYEDAADDGDEDDEDDEDENAEWGGYRLPNVT